MTLPRLRALHLIPLLVVASACTQAASDDPAPPAQSASRGDFRGGPPPRMDTTACKDKAVGAAVETTLPDGRVLKGTCQLVLVPDHPAGGPHDGAPPEGPAR